MYAEKVQFIKREENPISKIYDFKQLCINILDKSFEPEKAQVLKALLLGDKSDISEEIEDIFSKSNLSHILAISGLHITYITFYVEIILKKTVISFKRRNLIIVIFLIVFMIFVGASPSAMRACIMMIMMYIAKTLLRQNDFYISFVVSFIIILLINPYNIFSISMWLSFLGTLGIVLYSKFFQKLLYRRFKLKLEAIVLSMSAQILIFPIMWKNFGTVSLNFWISNLLTAQLVAPVIIIGYSSIILFPIRKFIVLIESILLEIFLKVVLISSRIPFNRFYLPIPSNFTIFTYYALIFGLIAFYKNHRFTFFKWVLKKKYKKYLGKIFAIFLSLVLACQVITFVPKDLRINFLDVRTRRLLFD